MMTANHMVQSCGKSVAASHAETPETEDNILVYNKSAACCASIVRFKARRG